ncbi:MAG: branched-chain amino acid ABC transporter permease/ATP-binding protein [Actinomycetota bacterium]|nr:branched-chain amino acid ABC transporter permease/ATP-binding protein [Actinomycetota bacterium]
MHQFLPFIVIGLANGAVYGLAGLGLVLTFKTSGIFNVGYGAVAALDVYLFYFLHAEHKLPWPVAALISLFVFAPLLGLALEFLARSLAGASETIKVVATVGLILIVLALGNLWHPTNAPAFPSFLPQSTVRILGVNITWGQVIVFLFSAAASAILYWFFQSVRLGILMRGVVDNADLVSMSGDNPLLVRRWAWIIGSVFASVAGIMLADNGGLQLDGTTLTTAVFAAFGAAAIGYFTNLPLTFAGGLIVGIADALVDKYQATQTWVGGLAPALPFVILFLVLILIPRGRLAQRRLVAQMHARRSYHAPWRVRLVAGVVAIVLLALVPVYQKAHLTTWSAALIDMILFLSLGLLVRRSGQISLCHLAFAAVGAAAFGHFSADHIPWLFSVILASLIAVPVGALIAIPAVRVSGVFLALATLGFGILAEEVFYTRSFMFGANPIGLSAPRPAVSIGGLNLSGDKGFYYLLLVIVVLVVATITVIANGRLGRLLEAMADSPLALETNGTTSTVLKVIVFCIAAAMASLAGALTAMLYHFGIGEPYFTSFSSLTLVALVVIMTIGDPWYAVIGAALYAVVPGYISGNTTPNVLTLLFGLGAATAAYGTRGGTTPQALRQILDRLGGRVPTGGPAIEVAPGPDTGPLPAAAPARAARAVPPVDGGGRRGLEVIDLAVHFGGVKAVDGVSLTAPTDRITGLVGPNGAGKTTTFNACSGLNRPTAGRIVLHGTDVSGDGPAVRARRGLGRTFQRTELFNSLTVRQNVALGREAALAGANPMAQVFGSRRAARQIDEATEEALALTGTRALADTQVGLLPIGQRRLVELARVLAGPFDMLLMDEPSSGLDGHETERFGTVLRSIVAARGCGILLVEHDMTLVRDVCDYVHVMDFGAPIFEGTPEEMHRSARVRAAYLGDSLPVGVGAAEGPEQEQPVGDDAVEA